MIGTRLSLRETLEQVRDKKEIPLGKLPLSFLCQAYYDDMLRTAIEELFGVEEAQNIGNIYYQTCWADINETVRIKVGSGTVLQRVKKKVNTGKKG